MTRETQDLVSWPRDLCGKLRLACEGTDSPTGVYPPLDRAGLPRWVWCLLTWTLAVANLVAVHYTDLAMPGFFIVLPMLWWVYTRWWAAVVAHLVFAAGFAAAGYLRGDGDESWWINPLIMVVVVLVTGTWGTWVHIVRFEAIHALADKEEALTALARTQSELVAAERAAGIAAEHERWSHEVHDTLAQGFISVINLAQTALNDLVEHPNGDPHEARALYGLLAEIEAVARDNLAEARALVAGESPSALRDDGLEAALRRLARAQEHHGVDISLVAELPAQMSSAFQVAVLRIVQESLSNVARHAQAQHVDVAVSPSETGELIVTVADDGVGAGGAPEGTGLTGMRARVETLGGTLTVDPLQEPDEHGRVGTVVEARMPL
ncbi:sensor histidine kinase [Actinomyces viscosus]|uniref:Oxygen sensor histidine kinase nreB n=1 Tax=Actinomyces viscosus TaxID=1656 RepID=A0A3S4VZ50_ACTVI|nr:ATP-binding protein [Actinomyces viscosus]TFH53427.1 sensor histidine kinase [Actinomyces viscosus]VEI18521.1 Oxygen sensor histidine kinase nreB [Actinomyces viscosus]